MMMTDSKAFHKAERLFGELQNLVRQVDAEGERVDRVERGLMALLLRLGRELLDVFIAQAGDGDRGAAIEQVGRTLQRLVKPRKRRYVSIFGEHDFEQRGYAPCEGQKIEERPVDRQLGLPAGEHSYVLQDWQQRLCLKESSEESAASLESMLNVSLPVGTAERLNQRLAEQAEPFRLRQPPPDPEQEAELLVYADDCKGVPMRRPVEERAKGHRRGKGEKANKKKMACVGSGYSVDCFVRSADDILDEIFRAESGEGRLFAP